MTHLERRTVLVSAAALAGGAAVAGLVLPETAEAEPLKGAAGPAAGTALDTLVFGSAESEARHRMTATDAEKLTGGLGQPARRFLPSAPVSMWGGQATFTMAVHPEKPTYVTVKLWGDDAGAKLGRLQLFCEGKQVGHHQLGAVDPLDIAGDEKRLPGRFFFHTLPLPPWATRGKTSLRLEVRSMGSLAVYDPAATYYRDLSTATRGIYRLYTHASPSLTLSRDDKIGAAPEDLVRPGDDSAVLDDIDAVVAGQHTAWLKATTLDLWGITALATGYGMPVSPCFENPDALERICHFIDGIHNQWQTDPTRITSSDQQWEGFGRVGLIMVMLEGHLDEVLARNVTGAATAVSRIDAYTRMLVESRDYWRRNLPDYTAQYIGAAIGIYACNRGLSVIAPGRAIDEAAARHYVHQAVGMSPYEGPEDAAGVPSWPLGRDYYLITPKGLTRELGYVGLYGEIIDGLIRLYDVVAGWKGVVDADLQKRMAEIVKTRSVFRYSAVDSDGHRAMRMQTVVGWRDIVYPGETVYAQRNAWDGHSLQAAAVLQDPDLVGYAAQMIRDNQFYNGLSLFTKDRGTRPGLTAARIRRDIETFRALPTSSALLPGSEGAPDFLWADEDDGVLALKNGTDVLYASVYWRARFGVNNLARIHLITASTEHSATVWQETRYDGTGAVYAEPDFVDQPYAADGGPVPEGPKLQQAFSGHKQPLVKAPAGMATPAVGEESPWSGRAQFYRCAYGRYLIGMNASATASARLDTRGWGRCKNLATGRTDVAGVSLPVAPLSTVVLYKL